MRQKPFASSAREERAERARLLHHEMYLVVDCFSIREARSLGHERFKFAPLRAHIRPRGDGREEPVRDVEMDIGGKSYESLRASRKLRAIRRTRVRRDDVRVTEVLHLWGYAVGGSGRRIFTEFRSATYIGRYGCRRIEHRAETIVIVPACRACIYVVHVRYTCRWIERHDRDVSARSECCECGRVFACRVIARKELECDLYLFEVGKPARVSALCARAVERGEHDRGKEPDNCDDDKKFYEREAPLLHFVHDSAGLMDTSWQRRQWCWRLRTGSRVYPYRDNQDDEERPYHDVLGLLTI